MFKLDKNEFTGAPAVISNNVVIPVEIFKEIQRLSLEDIKNLETNFDLPLYMSEFEDQDELIDYGILFQIEGDKVALTGYVPNVIEPLRSRMEEFKVGIKDLLEFTTPHTMQEIKEFTL